MTHVSNLLSLSALNSRLLFVAYTQSLPILQHLQVLGSTVYVFIYKEERKAKSAKWEPREKQGMLVGYNGHIIYRVYLPDEEKIIQIKDLRIVDNIDRKADSHVTSYDAITASKDYNTSNTPQFTLHLSSQFKPYLKILLNPTPPSPSNIQTRSGRISKPPKCYDAGMHNNVQVLLSQLTEVLNIPDWSVHHPPHSSTTLYQALDECDLLVCLANRIGMEDAIDLGHFANITNSLDIKEPETYEKAMASDQAEKWAEKMQ